MTWLRVNDLWFVSLDTLRLRRVLRGARAHAALRACQTAAEAARVRILLARVLPFGFRALVRAPRFADIRIFARRFVACAAAPIASGGPVWRSGFRATRIAPNALAGCRRFLAAGARACQGELLMPSADEKPGLRRAKRSKKALAGALRTIEAANDALLGADEVAARMRRYAADHDAPADDPAAFARLCSVVFAQGMGFAAFDKHRERFVLAFDGFVPERVARFGNKKLQDLLHAPLIRNEPKMRACIENAKRWVKRAQPQGSYLAAVAACAATDDAGCGWPNLVGMLRADFTRLAETASRQVLKRWGFFTALVNPAAHRLLARLGFIEADAEPPAVARLIGAVAQLSGRDPYAVEASLALFAGAGPCTVKPRCRECALLERCPTGSGAL